MKEDSILEFHQVSFRYPGAEKDALCDLSFSVRRSEFLVVAGESGCGKSTLLSHMKKNHIPFGKGSGSMTYISGRGDRIEIEEMEDLESVSKIGFVGQDTDGQVVSDKVWHELRLWSGKPGNLKRCDEKKDSGNRRVSWNQGNL